MGRDVQFPKDLEALVKKVKRFKVRNPNAPHRRILEEVAAAGNKILEAYELGAHGSAQEESPTLMGRAYLLSSGQEGLTIEKANKYLEGMDKWVVHMPEDLKITLRQGYEALPDGEMAQRQRNQLEEDLKGTSNVPFFFEAQWPNHSNTATAQQLHKYYYTAARAQLNSDLHDFDSPFVEGGYTEVFWSETRKGKEYWYEGEFDLEALGLPT